MLQYNIIHNQAERPSKLVHASRWAMGSALGGSLAFHGLAVALALMLIGGRTPAPDDTAAITVFVQPEAPPVAVASESKPSPPEPPLPDYAPPPPEESLAPPDFKSPPPPPPKPAQAASPHPPQPKSLPPPATAAAPTAPPAQAAPSAAMAAPSGPPSVAPGWNALLAAWLAAHKSYPASARKRSEEGEVTVRFNVEPDGRVSEVSVVKGSGYADLDTAALGMLQGAALPPPGAPAVRTVRIHFHLDD
jgi:TonB family protein